MLFPNTILASQISSVLVNFLCWLFIGLNMEFFDVVISFAREKDVPVQYISEMLRKKEAPPCLSQPVFSAGSIPWYTIRPCLQWGQSRISLPVRRNTFSGIVSLTKFLNS